MTGADLRQRLRDRTVIIFGLLVPLGLIIAFHAVLGGTTNPKLQPVTVAVSVPHGDSLGRALVGVVRSVGVMKVTVKSGTEPAVRALTKRGDADVAVIVPDGFTEQVRAGTPVTVRIVDGAASLETGIVEAVVNGTLDRMHAAAVAAQAGAASGVPRDRVAKIAAAVASGTPQITMSQGQAADEQLSVAGSLVAGQAGLFLMFT